MAQDKKCLCATCSWVRTFQYVGKYTSPMNGWYGIWANIPPRISTSAGWLCRMQSSNNPNLFLFIALIVSLRRKLVIFHLDRNTPTAIYYPSLKPTAETGWLEDDPFLSFPFGLILPNFQGLRSAVSFKEGVPFITATGGDFGLGWWRW